jgi:hypothetical protein
LPLPPTTTEARDDERLPPAAATFRFGEELNQLAASCARGRRRLQRSS